MQQVGKPLSCFQLRTRKEAENPRTSQRSLYQRPCAFLTRLSPSGLHLQPAPSASNGGERRLALIVIATMHHALEWH